jgi:hypothetical protein
MVIASQVFRTTQMERLKFEEKFDFWADHKNVKGYCGWYYINVQLIHSVTVENKDKTSIGLHVTVLLGYHERRTKKSAN